MEDDFVFIKIPLTKPMFQIIVGTTQEIPEIMGNVLHQKQTFFEPLINKNPSDASKVLTVPWLMLRPFPKMLDRAFQSLKTNTTHSHEMFL